MAAAENPNLPARAQQAQPAHQPEGGLFNNLDLSKVNMLSPIMAQERVDAFHVARLAVVHVDSDCERGSDVYFSGAFMQKNERALTKTCLMRMAAAANVGWDTRQSGILPSSDPDIIIFRSVGLVLTVDGRQIEVPGTKELDCRRDGTEASKIRRSIAKSDKYTNDRARDNAFEDAFNRLQEHRVAMCETKSKLRVLRDVLGLKGKYTLEELKKPFIIPRIDKSPDFADPLVQNLLVAGGRDAILAVFGFKSDDHARAQLGLEQPAQALPAAPVAALSAPVGDVKSEPAPAPDETDEPREQPPQAAQQPVEAKPVEAPTEAQPPWVTDRNVAQRRIFAIAKATELTPEGMQKTGDDLAAAIRERISFWVDETGDEGLTGWKKNGPSLSESTHAQLIRIGDKYAELQTASENPGF